MVCESAHRFLLLFTCLKRVALKKKVLVFFSTCAATQFYAELLITGISHGVVKGTEQSGGEWSGVHDAVSVSNVLHCIPHSIGKRSYSQYIHRQTRSH